MLRYLTIATALLLAHPVFAEVPLDPGQTATIRLSAQGDLAYPVAPLPPHAPANHGAILSIDIDEPGLYHVALSAPGWIDIFLANQPVARAGERVGEPGSGIARIVDYNLTPGHYTVALSGMAAGEVHVRVSR